MGANFTAIDLFAGCGGLSEGLRQAGFNVIAAVEINKYAAEIYAANHKETLLFNEDIRKLDMEKINEILNGETLYLLAGCPPCQGFSSMRRLNRKEPVDDPRNDLILEYLRFVKELMPLTLMMENVPSIINYDLFKHVANELKAMGYNIDFAVVNVSKYGVPQRRKRFVLVGSRIDEIKVSPGNDERRTVKDVIGDLESAYNSADPVHKIFPKHNARIQEMINKIPKNGGSRRDLPEEYILDCHKKDNIGFNDVYGRLKWDNVSSTITGGCLNPSKGRFLHPEENRCISAREASLLQTFPPDYVFLAHIPKTSLALMIGNALPPMFSKIQSANIFSHIAEHYDKKRENK